MIAPFLFIFRWSSKRSHDRDLGFYTSSPQQKLCLSVSVVLLTVMRKS